MKRTEALSIKKKIKTGKEIERITQHLKKQGKRIVTYNGSFDVLHVGHIKSIQEAKAQGDILIILLNSDASIRIYKGPNRPIVSQRERIIMIAAIDAVDYVSVFNDINPKKVLARIKPNVHCNGSDWGRSCIERKVVEENGGRICILRWERGHSTTDLIKKILDVYRQPAIKAVFLDRDGTVNLNKKGYVHKIADFEFVPHVFDALKKLSKTDYKIIIVTNQSGIGRRYYTQEDFEKLNAWILEEFSKKKIRIDRVYYCHHTLKDRCGCRKPNVGMFIQAVKDFGISLNNSWFIGDNKTDMIAGREANVKTIKLGERMPKALKLQPHYYAKDLQQAADIILNNE